MIGIRRALAQFILAFYTIQFIATALIGDDRMMACFLALGACYGLAFFGLAAEWFWARWFATGLGNFGTLALALIPKVGAHPAILFLGLTHLAIMLCLLGEGMAAKYEHSEATAERYGFPQDTMAMLRRAVKSAGSALPPLILMTLGPKEEGLELLMGGALLATGVAATWGLVRNRTWGIFAAAATGVVVLLDAFGVFGGTTGSALFTYADPGSPLQLMFGEAGELGRSHMLVGSGFGVLAGLFLLMIPVAFAGPLYHAWRRAS